MEKTLKEMRKEKGLTQKQLADAIGIHVNFISKWERGETAPTAEELEALRRELSLGEDTTLICCATHVEEATTETAETTEVEKKEKEKTAEKKKIKKAEKETKKISDFAKNALYTENFDPIEVVKKSEHSFVELLFEGKGTHAIVNGNPVPVVINHFYIPTSGYKKWLRHAMPDAAITTDSVDEIVVHGGSMDGHKTSAADSNAEERDYLTSLAPNEHAYMKVGVSVRRNGYPPFSDFGFSRINGYDSPVSFVNYAKADATGKVLRNMGFGEGLDWDVLEAEADVFISFDSEEFFKYEGPVYAADGKLVREGTKSAEECDKEFSEKLQFIVSTGKVEVVKEEDEPVSMQLINAYNGTLSSEFSKFDEFNDTEENGDVDDVIIEANTEEEI